LKARKIWVIVGVVLVIVIVAAGAALWNYHEQPQFCAICHIMQPYLESWESSDFLAHAHARENITCLECHEPTIGQQVQEGIKFVTKDYETPLEPRRFDKEWCFRCHEHGSYAELIERTKDYTVDGEKINPHAYKVDPEAANPHRSGKDDELDCYNCHKIHGESPGINICYGCHHTGTFDACSSSGCHEN